MCGISVWCSKNDLIDKNKFKEMNNIIRHRGPDDEGYYYDVGLAMGHRRLSIIDISANGHQPFVYKNRYAIVFNGEIYNYIELRNELKKKGYKFETDTDTEVLIAMYDYYGESCVNYFNGMWAFVIYDKYEKILWGSRDRFGVKPLYYYYKNGELLLASEIKQILLIKEECAKANKIILKRYLVYGDLDYTNDTFFYNIYKIPAGNSFMYKLKEHELFISPYYKLKYRQNIKIYRNNYKLACNDFMSKFYDSVKLRLRSDVKVGYCLSGGLDSSAIVCIADKILKENYINEKQHAVSSCSEDKRYDEQEYIDAVIKQTGFISHKIYTHHEKLFNDLDNIIWHMDEPFGSTSVYAQWNVFEEAKKHNIKVMLDGQGADEQLAGYTSFYKVLFCYYLRRMRFIKFYEEWKDYKELRYNTEQHVELPSFKYLLAVAYLPSKILKKVEHLGKKSSLPFSDEMIAECDRERANLYNIGNYRNYFMDNIYLGMQALLHYEDRNSMAFSIESRVPFLDVNVTNILSEMPITYKIKNARTKAVMRDALKNVFPEKIYNRYSKLGFATPEDQWINQNESVYRQELIEACNNLEGLVDKEKILQWYYSEARNKRGDSTVWRIICAGHWVKLFHVRIE